MSASRSNKPSRGDDTPVRDISPVLSGWDYEPGTLNVRKIVGLDGKPKLQMRLDLGLLQMEMTGRPDGQRPHGFESLLDYHEQQLADHDTGHDEEAFHLTPQQCQGLREEAAQYYHRYLSLFVLGEFEAVVRDTSRNLRLLDFCRQHAVDDHDRAILEQYRPYITMMNARAEASIHYRSKRYPEAMAAVRDGIRRIRRFFKRIGQEEAYRHASEVKVLKRFASDIRKRLPVDPVVSLQKKLEKAVQSEAYEEAARLRDEIARLTGSRSGGA
jgi:hypothetical protein